MFALPARPIHVELDPRWTLVREIEPMQEGDVTFDDTVDAADLMLVVLNQGHVLPTERRQDGQYDPLYDINGDFVIDARDLDAVVDATRWLLFLEGPAALPRRGGATPGPPPQLALHA